MKKELKCDVKKNLKEKTAKKYPPPHLLLPVQK